MSDTVKLRRPDFERRGRKASGRVEHDERGNAIWVRSRASDSQEVAVDDSLAIVDEAPKADIEQPSASLPPARKKR